MIWRRISGGSILKKPYFGGPSRLPTTSASAIGGRSRGISIFESAVRRPGSPNLFRNAFSILASFFLSRRRCGQAWRVGKHTSTIIEARPYTTKPGRMRRTPHDLQRLLSQSISEESRLWLELSMIRDICRVQDGEDNGDVEGCRRKE